MNRKVVAAVRAQDADMAMGISPIPLPAPWLTQFLEGLTQLFFNHQDIVFHEIASLKESTKNVEIDVMAQNADIAVTYSRFSSMLFSSKTGCNPL